MSRHRNAFLIPVLLVLVFASRVSASEKVAVTWSPAGDDRVRFAASEFSGYAEKLTGHGVSLTTEAGELADASIIVLICAVGKGARKGVFEVGARLEKDVPASEEGFLLRSQDSDGRKVLYIIGRTSRAATYGVYHYLEKYCRVGFFKDFVEYVPAGSGLVLDEVDEVAEPVFEYRGIGGRHPYLRGDGLPVDDNVGEWDYFRFK